MGATKKEPVEHLNLDHYHRLLASVEGVIAKGDKIPCTTMNGNMYSFLYTNGDVALRLPASEREAFLAKFNTKLFDGYGMVQKEYVTIPADQLASTADFTPYLAMSHEYVKTLKVKPSKKGG
jgi:hypothetical protein